MTFLGKESSVEDGSLIELYHFVTDDAGIFRWTSGDESITVGLDLYEPQPIERDEPEVQGGQTDQSVLNVKMRGDNPIPRRYVEVVPPGRDLLTIFQLHKTDTPTPEVITFFSGFVTSVKHVPPNATLRVASTTFQLDKPIPRRTYRGMCNHQLGDTGCRKNLVADGFQFNTNVTTISGDGLTIVVDGIDPTGRPNGFFDAGRVGQGSLDFRMITSDVTSGGNTRTFTLLLPFQNLTVGTIITSAAGCDHQYPTCRDKFSNARRFGGFFVVPNSNPFTKGLT